MHQTVSERKREILIRSAEARLGVVESLDSAMRGAGRTWELIRVPRRVARWGALAGGGVLGVALLKWLLGGGRSVVAAAPVASVAAPQGGALALVGRLLVQLAPVLLAPWLKTHVLGEGSSGSKLLARLHPGRLFFRWLGLEK